MINRLAEFAEELRAAGLPVSMVEVLDAAEATQHADLESMDGLRFALAATMIKSDRHREAFDRIFDVYFVFGGPADFPNDDEPTDDLTRATADALAHDDHDRLLDLIREAVERFGRTGTGSLGGDSYYAYRVLRRLNPDQIRNMLLEAASAGDDGFRGRLAGSRAERSIRLLREEVRREILRRVAESRGRDAAMRSVDVSLVEDLDLQHATRIEIDAIQRAVGPLARKLATRLSQRRRHGQRGRLDVRRTIRRSLGHGGVFVDPRFRSPRVAKPQIVLLCDTSGSMATFSRFTMQLAHAIASELASVRSFVFVEGIDEVTRLFTPGNNFTDSLARIATEADIVRADGHSDYGRSFDEFVERYLGAVTSRATVIVVGDARSNYRDASHEAFRTIADRARAVFWLNPEAERFWNTGDSIMSAYAPWCDRVDEVHSLRQLERFIERAALPGVGAGRPRRAGRPA